MSYGDRKRAQLQHEQVSQPAELASRTTIAPGKRTRTQSLPPRLASASPPVQQKPGPAVEEAREGQATLTQQWLNTAIRPDIHPPPVQMRGGGTQPAEDVHRLAAQGSSGAATALPHLDQVQYSFGRHDVSGIEAHIGGPAAQASQAMGAEAYASGNHVAFRTSPDLHTAAHEAAHVVQQRAGVNLSGGVGQAGDAYEQHADAVANAVVKGESAESLLGPMSSGGRMTTGVQRQQAADEEPAATPLTMPQRNALHTLLASRLNSAFTKYAIACEEVNDQLQAEQAARVELVMTLISVGFVFATPALGGAIRALANGIPSGASVTTYRVALGMMSHADQIAGAMAEVGKAAAKPAVSAALASDAEDYLAALSQGFSLGMDRIVGHVAANIENTAALPDAEIWLYVSQWDPQNVTQGAYESSLLASARAFRSQVQPIGTPVVAEMGGPTNLGQNASGQWHLYEEYASGRYTQRTAVTGGMLEGALHRSFAEFGGPWRMTYMEDQIISGGDVVPMYTHGKHAPLRREYARFDER